MANHLKFCSCRYCRAGKHTKSGGATVRAVVRKVRRKVKAALKRGETDIPKAAGVEYTD
jgi:hypothetical protein